MAIHFLGTRQSTPRGPIEQSAVVHPVGAPQNAVRLPSAGTGRVTPVRGVTLAPKTDRRKMAQAFSRTLTARPRFVSPTLTQKVGNPHSSTDNQTRTKTATRRQQAVRRTPGRVPNGKIMGISTSAGSFVFLSPAGRSTVNGIVHRPPQPLVPVLAARLKKSGSIFG